MNRRNGRRALEAEVFAFWRALVRDLRRSRHHTRNPLLDGYASAFDPRPRAYRGWLSEAEGMWADWAELGCDLRQAMEDRQSRK